MDAPEHEPPALREVDPIKFSYSIRDAVERLWFIQRSILRAEIELILATGHARAVVVRADLDELRAVEWESFEAMIAMFPAALPLLRDPTYAMDMLTLSA